MESHIADLLAAQRFETARRVCLDALARGEGGNAVRLQLHQALRWLGDLAACRVVLADIVPSSDDERLTCLLLQGEDYHRLSEYGFFRGSAEEKAGLTGDQYFDQMQARATACFTEALPLAVSDAQRRRAAETLARAGRKAEAAALMPPAVETPAAAPVPQPTATLAGRLTFPDGAPVADALVTLGLQAEVREADPATYLRPDMGYEPHIGAQATLTVRTDADGCYRLVDVPAARHDFLAVTLDPARYAIATRFLAHDLRVDGDTTLDAVVDEWQSATPRPIARPFPATLTRGGATYRRVHETVLANPFYFDFPRQLVRVDVPELPGAAHLMLLASHAPDTPQPLQRTDTGVAFFAEVPEVTDRVYALYATDGDADAATYGTLTFTEDGDTAVIDTGRAAFRLPAGWDCTLLPPLLAVRGDDGRWRGEGRLVLPDGVTMRGRMTTILEQGPLSLTVEVAYLLSNDTGYRFRFTAHQGEAYLLTHEICPDVPGMAFEFSLREFNGGRGFLHWTPEHGNPHWRTLAAEERELARLQESVAWWIPPQGFGYAMTADGLAERDYIGVFTLRRGEWIDRLFEKIAQGPGENREMDWPFPEMVGSTVSMITANTREDGDALFRFAAFDGERHWGILVSTLERNDGPHKEISRVQHKNSSPRLQNFKDWQLDLPDIHPRPSVVIERDALTAVRAKTDDPLFAHYWEMITGDRVPGPRQGVHFAIAGDPAIAWRIKRKLVSVAHIRSKMTLYGRDYADCYSPVGARPITPWAEEYDLVAASGVFTPDEERLVRAFFLLMGHMYLETDLMNWRYNSRNANFEADRVDVVGTVGMCFRDNPDARAFITHAADSMERALEVYATPGSGKWYENPACYYLQALKCRTNLAFHLAMHGIQDPTQIARMRDFLRWGVLLLTPRYPSSYPLMCGGTDDAGYRATRRVRRIPPVGDHAHIGPWIPEHFALMAKVYRRSDPAFADLLLWAYQEGGADGGYHGNMPLLMSALTADDLQPAPPQTLSSRRLEGFGAIFRGHFAEENEFYLLLKLGPGGYRYHRTEGSIILFADGKPLVFDGGEAGETWRHSTLSFHDVHMPLAPGHIERFVALPRVEFAQGVHPKALSPGEPVFLSDLCHHELVEVAYQRFNEPNPADARSVTWVKDEYVVLHDELRLPAGTQTHWHLQAVAHGETGSAAEGYRFTGRFGTDLQVLFPGQSFEAESVETVATLEYHMPKEESFAMRHLQLTASVLSHVLAVLRPLSAGKDPLTAEPLCLGDRTVGVYVEGAALRDWVFLSREGMDYVDARIRFTGKYAVVHFTFDVMELSLLDGAVLEVNGVRVESDGPAVAVRVDETDSVSVVAEGQGTFTLTLHGRTITETVAGRREFIMQATGT